MEGLRGEVAGGAFRYRGAVHWRLPDLPRWHAGLHQGSVVWGCREGDSCFLILDYRQVADTGPCRIELWEPVRALDAPVRALLALASSRPGARDAGSGTLADLVMRICGAPEPA